MPGVIAKTITFDDVIRHVLDDRGPCPSTERGAPCINDWIHQSLGSFAYWTRLLRVGDIDQAIDWVRGQLTRAENTPYEVSRMAEKQFARKARFSGSTVSGDAKCEPAAEFDINKLCDFAANVPERIDEAWLAERSPDPINIDCVEFQHKVYGPIPNVFINSAMKWEHKWGFSVTYDGHPKAAEFLRERVRKRNNIEGAWYCINPLKEADDRRLTENLASFRYALLECDKESDEANIGHLWLRAVVQIPGVVALTTSGNVSVHALVRLPAAAVDAASWEKHKREVLIPQYVPLGACTGSLSANRYSRLPGVIRGDNGREQKLLYLDSAATSETTIWKPANETAEELPSAET